jgi:hypothetical protein
MMISIIAFVELVVLVQLVYLQQLQLHPQQYHHQMVLLKQLPSVLALTMMANHNKPLIVIPPSIHPSIRPLLVDGEILPILTA